jgi:hypothetical protein
MFLYVICFVSRFFSLELSSTYISYNHCFFAEGKKAKRWIGLEGLGGGLG